MMHYVHNDKRWYTMKHDDKWWYTMIHDDTRWQTMIHDETRRYTMTINDLIQAFPSAEKKFGQDGGAFSNFKFKYILKIKWKKKIKVLRWHYDTGWQMMTHDGKWWHTITNDDTR